MKPLRPLDFIKLDGSKNVAPLLALSVFLLTGGEQNTFVPPPPKVEVAVPVQKSITRYLDATGNTSAIKNAAEAGAQASLKQAEADFRRRHWQGQ
jgi:hypothetical protein